MPSLVGSEMCIRDRAIPGRSGSVSAEYDVTLGYPNAISLGSNIPDMGTSESVTNFQKTT